MAEEPQLDPLEVSELPEELLWLIDAPLFIDEKQVEALYDAILRPDYEEISRVFGDSFSSKTTVGGKISIGSVLPWLFKAEAGVEASEDAAETNDRTVTTAKVSNPYRHLISLILQYSRNEALRSRLVLGKEDGTLRDADGNAVDLGDDAFVQNSPRALVMLDLPAGTKFIPAALELEGGQVALVFEDLARRLQKPGKPSLPAYPKDDSPDAVVARKAYWDWFVESYDRNLAMIALEAAVSDAPVNWVDYRFFYANHYVHAHMAARGQYETGVFGYQIVSRGGRHGLRLVASLKSEPGLNVLAVFER